MNDGERQFGATAILVPFDLHRDVDEDADLSHLEAVQKRAIRSAEDAPSY